MKSSIKAYLIALALGVFATQAHSQEQQRESPRPPAAAAVDDSKPRPPQVGETIDLEFTAMDLREVSLAAMKGKVVLVDFWAMWCPPCMAELPNVKRVYDAYRDKGFEIIGISLDKATDRQKLKEFLARNDMTWPQYFDGRHWDNVVSDQFGVSAIPAAWLFDKEGKLVTRDARGNTLETEVARLTAAP